MFHVSSAELTGTVCSAMCVRSLFSKMLPVTSEPQKESGDNQTAKCDIDDDDVVEIVILKDNKVSGLCLNGLLFYMISS